MQLIKLTEYSSRRSFVHNLFAMSPKKIYWDLASKASTYGYIDRVVYCNCHIPEKIRWSKKYEK